MKVEIIYGEQSETIELPPETDFVGIEFDFSDGHKFCVSNFDLPDELCDGRVERHTEQRELHGDMSVTVTSYRLSGAAKALSLRGYDGLVFCDAVCGDVRIIITV